MRLTADRSGEKRDVAHLPRKGAHILVRVVARYRVREAEKLSVHVHHGTMSAHHGGAEPTSEY